MTKTEPTVAERITGVDANIREFETAKARDTEDLENALAVDRDVAPIWKRIAQTDSAIELARAHRRGLDRLLVIETRDALAASIAEAEQMAADAEAAFRDVVARIEQHYTAGAALDVALIQARVERDNGGTRLYRRNAAFAKFCTDNVQALARAERGAENQSAGEPADVGALRS